MRLKIVPGYLLSLGSLILLLGLSSAKAFGQTNSWSTAYRLSSASSEAGQASMVPDQFGLLHTFWVESGFLDKRAVIQYAPFDGESWKVPLDIYVTKPTGSLASLAPVVDQQGSLYLAWTEGIQGPVFYSHAPANDAYSAQKWSTPVSIDIPAFQVRLQIDSKGLFQLIYTDFYGDQPGVYYLRSEDQGESWSEPTWLDPDIPSGHAPSWLNFSLDEEDNLHVVWSYYSSNDGGIDAVRYINSLDGGKNWSRPFYIDRADQTEDELRLANPGLIVQGHNIHVIWAGDADTHREHRYSADAGRTWSETSRIFGDLHGEAIGDGLAVDGKGRIHFIGQIRDPAGIYHAYWDRDHWEGPFMIYRVEGSLGAVHAHNTRLAIRAGNQMVVTFTDSPTDPEMRLFTMYGFLSDTSPLPALPTPIYTLTPSAGEPFSRNQTSTTVAPAPTAVVAQNDLLPKEIEDARSPAAGVWSAVMPVLLMIAGSIAWLLVRKR